MYSLRPSMFDTIGKIHSLGKWSKKFDALFTFQNYSILPLMDAFNDNFQ